MNNIYKKVLFRISQIKFTTVLFPLIAMILLLPGIGFCQTTVFSENMGTPSANTAVATYVTQSAPATFQNKGVLSYVGNADVRNSQNSSGYTGFSGSGNVFFATNTNRYFTIYNINTSSYTGIALSFGFYKELAGNITSSNFVVEFATDYDPIANTGTFTSLSYSTITTGSIWSLISTSGTIPSSTTLAIRFRQNQTAQQIRIDDVTLTGITNDNCSAAINLSPSPSCVTTSGTTVGATESLGYSSCTGGGGSGALDVWYKFTANGTSSYDISATPASGRMTIVLYSGSCPSLPNAYIGCAEGTAANKITLSTAILPAETYYYRLYIRGGQTTTFITCVAGPPACATLTSPASGAINISVEPLTLTWSASTAATSYDVYFGTTSTPPLLANVTGTSANVPGALSNTTYYWYVVPKNANGPATGCISNIRSFTTAAGPGNDECAGAASLAVNAAAISGTTVNADQTLSPALCSATTSSVAYDVWYSFNANNTSQSVTLVSGSGFNGVVEAYSGTCGSLVSLGCANATALGGTETLNLSGLTACNTYYLRVYGYTTTTSNITGTFTIKVAGTSSLTAPTLASASPTAYCADNISGNITLTASGGSGGTLTWYTGGCGSGTAIGTGTSLIIAKPTSTTIYYVRREFSCDVTACASAIVTVNPLPTVFNLTGGGAYCNGGTGVTITLSGSQTGVNYQLYRGTTAVGSAVPGNGSSYTTPLITTAGTYTLIGTNATTGCQKTMNGSVVISVTPRPTGAISGSPTICPGQTATVSIEVTGTGPWSGTLSNGQAFNGSSSPISVNISPSVTTSYTIATLSDANCASKGTDRSGTATVTVNPVSADPTSATASPAAICSGTGASTTLTLNGGGGLSGEVIHWYSGSCAGTSVGTGNGLVVVPAATTTYYGRYENTSPCVYNSICKSVTVTVTTPPSATISYSGSPFCSKIGTAAVNRTGSAGGTYSSTTGLSINSTTGTINIGASNSGKYIITYTIGASGGCSIYTTTASIIIEPNTWKGIDTIWNNPANWSCNTVPDNMSNVFIPADSSKYPVIPEGDFSVRDITIQAGASLITANPRAATQAVLTIYGKYSNSGTLVDSGKIVLAGSAMQTFPGIASNITALNELEVNNTSGVSIDKSITITGGLFPTTGNIALNDNYITLKSDSTVVNKRDRFNSAFVGELGTGASFSYGNGRFVIERYFHAERSWRLITAPVSKASSSTIFNAWQLGGKTTASGASAGSGVFITGPVTDSGLDAGVNGNYSLKVYDAKKGVYIPVSNTKGLKLSPGTYKSGGTGENIGYFIFVRGDRNPALVSPFNTKSDSTTLRDTGMIQTGTQTFNFPLDTITGNKFILLPNPYASPVDFPSIAAGNSSIQSKFWVWDPGLGSVGGYTYLDAGTGYTATPPGPGGQNRNIQSCQAIFVQTTNKGSASVSFHENYKSTRTIRLPLFRPLILTTPQLAINLNFLNEDSSTLLSDGVLAQFSTSFSNAVDDQDGLKFTNLNESFALMRDGQLLTVERRKLINETDTLFFNLRGASQRSYQFEFIPDGWGESGFTSYLEDSYLKTSIPVSLTDTVRINFSLNSDTASQALNRFTIVFKPSAPVPLTFTKVKAYQQGSNINVEWTVENELNMKEYYLEKSADGTRFTKIATAPAMHNNGNTASYISPDALPFNGANYYRVHSISRSGDDLYSNVVKVTIGIGAPQMIVYPNPMVNGVITLQMINQPKGIYGIRLINNLGQMIIAKELNHEEGSSSETLLIDKKIPHGSYQLEITGILNQKTTTNVIY